MGAAKVESLVGKKDSDFFPRDHADSYYADERAVIESGQPLINREEPVVDPTGSRVWLLTTKAPLRDTHGRIVGLVGMGRDITERKREEEQHRLTEARLQAILDNTTAVIYVKDKQGRFLLINKQFEDLFHVSREQVVNKTDYDLFPQPMADAFRVNDHRVLETRVPLEFEEVAPRDGEVRTFISIKFPLCDAAGAAYAVCGISTDITERKRDEQLLRESEALKGAILESALDSIIAMNHKGKVIEWNPAAERMFGYRRSDAVGREMSELIIPPSLQDQHRQGLARFLSTGEGRVLGKRVEMTARRADGSEFPVELAITVTKRDGLPAFTGCMRDITDRKLAETKLVEANADLLEMNNELTRSEEDLRKALADVRASHEQLKATQLQLIQSEKMESIGTLAAGVAHEVKNPLQTILMGLAYLSKNIPGGDETIAMVLSDMRDGAKRAAVIVRDLLYLSVTKQLETREEDFNAVVERSLCLVNYELHRSRISLVRELAVDLPCVPLDKAKLEQVFINLFMNAIQAMPKGGTLTVKTSARRLAETGQMDGKVHAPFTGGDTVVVAEVQDTGAGIPPDKLPHLFTPFITTKPSGVGTGLGLPVTKQIIDLHGGTIDIGLGSSGGAQVTLMLKAECTRSHERSHEHQTYKSHEQEADSSGRRRNQLYSAA